MPYIPIDIQNLIMHYVQAFNQVERDIDECLDHFFTLEHRASLILEGFCDRYDCHVHSLDVRCRVKDVVVEANRLLDKILCDQTVLPIQKNMLIYLQSELMLDSYNAYLPHLPQSLTDESYQYD